MLRFLRRCLSMAALTIALAPSAVMAQTLPTQNWPTRPITLVVPFAAGSASDTVGRILAARRRDHMIDGGGAAERPLPVRLALHARAGLVAGDHLAGAHGGGDLLCCRAERLARACQPVGDRALRDCQAEQPFAPLGQTLER